MIIFVVLAIVIFLAYIVTTISIFKQIPESLSDTYYMYNSLKSRLGYIFPAVLTLIVALIMPTWLDASDGQSFQFLVFFSCAALLFVGAAPNFKNLELEKKVHTTAAIVAAVSSILWSLLTMQSWITLLFWLLLSMLIAVLTKTLKKCYIYHLEFVAFMYLFVSLIEFLMSK